MSQVKRTSLPAASAKYNQNKVEYNKYLLLKEGSVIKNFDNIQIPLFIGNESKKEEENDNEEQNNNDNEKEENKNNEQNQNDQIQDLLPQPQLSINEMLQLMNNNNNLNTNDEENEISPEIPDPKKTDSGRKSKKSPESSAQKQDNLKEQQKNRASQRTKPRVSSFKPQKQKNTLNSIMEKLPSPSALRASEVNEISNLKKQDEDAEKKKIKKKGFNNKRNNDMCSNLLKEAQENEKELMNVPYAQEKEKKNKTFLTIGRANGIPYQTMSLFNGGGNNANNFLNIIRGGNKKDTTKGVICRAEINLDGDEEKNMDINMKEGNGTGIDEGIGMGMNRGNNINIGTGMNMGIEKNRNNIGMGDYRMGGYSGGYEGNYEEQGFNGYGVGEQEEGMMMDYQENMGNYMNNNFNYYH